MTTPRLRETRPYPFARLRKLFEGVTPNPAFTPVSLGIGEPRHPTPECITKALAANFAGLAKYPGTAGSPEFKAAVISWCEKRYGVTLAANQVLPCLGSREALFSFVQSAVDSTHEAYVVMPTPFYQIYEGAAILAGAKPYFVPLTPANHFRMNIEAIPAEVLAKTQVVFVCSPSNPTGSVMRLADWKRIFELSDTYGFVVASDECYSEIYFEEGKAPLGALTAAKELGRTDFRNLIVFQSLSKRSNAPGLRSGFTSGDAHLMEDFLLYRTYHGSAMSLTVQAASIAAWSDEAHVIENRRLYREKFAAAQPVLASVLEAPMPEAAFYLWVKTPGDDQIFARELYREKAVTVLPGSFLSRPVNGIDPAAGFIRLALVSEPELGLEAAQRIRDFVKEHY